MNSPSCKLPMSPILFNNAALVKENGFSYTKERVKVKLEGKNPNGVGTGRVLLYFYPCWGNLKGSGITKNGTRSVPNTSNHL